MAEVFKAKTHGVEGFEKLVVIKRILPHLSRNARFVSMFINEAKISVSLNHGNIVQVYNLGKHGEDYYIAMEYVHGRDLMQVLKVCRQSQRRLPSPLVLYIISEIAKGLDYAHRKQDPAGKSLQIVHRDISPHNIVLSYEGEVKIVDFGIARIVSEVMDESPKARMGGKFAYMSPEQGTGAGLDPRSDLFSLGLVMYEMLTGQKAYQARTVAEKLEQVRHARFPSPRSIVPDIPEAVEQVLLKLLALNPDDRYPMASDLYEELTELMFSSCGVVTAQALASFMRDVFHDDILREQDSSGLKAVVGSLERMERDVDERTDLSVDAGPAPASPPASPAEALEVKAEAPDPDDTTGGEGGGLTVPPGALPLVEAKGNQKRTLVVLMAEPIGLVDLAMQLTDDRYLQLLNALVAEVKQLAAAHGGHLDSFLYDRFCVLWGLQHSQEDDGERAVSCALALISAVERLKSTHRITLSLAASLHQGTALVGTLEGRVRHTALGDTFKFPLRALHDCEPGQVWVSEALKERVDVGFKLSAGRSVRTFWGRREAMTHQVLGAHTAYERSRIEAARSLKRDRWLPRRDELEQLAQVLSTVNSRRGTVLALTGETGIGKSRLVAEIGRLVHRNNVGWMVGHCQYKERDTPLAVFRDLLAAGCRILPGDSREEVRDKLNSLLELGLQPLDVRFFGTLFNSADEASLLAASDGGDVVESIFRSVRRLLRAMCADRPLIVVFENVQWMDSATWRLLQSLIEQAGDLAVLFLLTYRQSFTPPLEGKVSYREIRLEPLNLEKTTEFMQSLLGVDSIPPAFAEELHKRSDGNPLYLEQLIKYLLEGRHLVVEARQLRRLSIQAAALLPPTLSGLIESRVDNLSISGRELLQGLAVGGRVVELEVLRHIWNSQFALEPVLEELSGRDLVAVQDGRVSFRNNLTWEVAYHSLAHRDRRALHLKLGEAIEQVFSQELVRHAEELFHHFEEGGAFYRAGRYATMAGDRYSSEDFLSNAINFYLKAVELYREASEPGLDEESLLYDIASVYLKAGRLQMVTGDRASAEKTLEHGLAIAGDLENDSLEIRFLLELGPLRAEKGELLVARSYLEHALELAEDLSSGELCCAVLDALGTFYLDVNERTTAIRTFERGLRLATELERPLALARLLRGRGTWRIQNAQYEGALSDLDQALELAETAGDKLLSGRIITNIGNIYNLMGKAEEAMTYYRRAGEIYQHLGFIRGAIINTHNIGDLYLRTGRLGRAYASLQESRNMAREYRWTKGEAFNMVYMGYIEAEMGDPETGLKTLHDGLALCRKVGLQAHEGIGLWLEGRYFLRREPEHARALLVQAIERVQELGDQQLVDDIHKSLNSLT